MSTELLVTTADELLEMPFDGFRYELVKGVLKKMSPAGGEHSRIALYLGSHLVSYIVEHNLGVAYGADGGFKVGSNPDTVLCPDLSFVSRERAANLSDDRKFLPLAPDLAVEVLSPGDTYSEAEDKVEQWLSAKTRVVMLVDPRKKIVTIYRPQAEPVVLRKTDILDLPDIIPGWSLPVSKAFPPLTA